MERAKQVGMKPVINYFSRVLILGSMPGRISLEKDEYYANPRNDFWPLIFSLFRAPLPEDYESRVSFSLSRGIALWDVLETCLRKGSSDSEIREGKVNNFEKLFSEYPHIKAVFFNGKKAGKLFSQNKGYLPENIICFYLPSSSPAHTISQGEKMEAWKGILNFIGKN